MEQESGKSLAMPVKDSPPVRRRSLLANLLINLVLVLFGVGLALGMVESFARFRHLDQARVAKALYYQGSYVPAHQVSQDPVLHYELRPGAQYRSTGPWGEFEIHINSLGARSPERTVDKAPGVFRILCFGPSTTFGADVADDLSIPAVLELSLQSELDRQAGAMGGVAPRIEVWNFGTSAYVHSQTAQLALNKLPVLKPDMIVMLLNNGGRRPFLISQDAFEKDHLPELMADPWSWEENFARVPGVPERLHIPLLKLSALYRYYSAQQLLEIQGPLPTWIYGRKLNVAKSRELVEVTTQQGVPLISVSYRDENQQFYEGIPESHFINLWETLPGNSSLDAHPPARILGTYAQILAHELVERHLVKVEGGDPTLALSPVEPPPFDLTQLPGEPPFVNVPNPQVMGVTPVGQGHPPGPPPGAPPPPMLPPHPPRPGGEAAPTLGPANPMEGR